MKRIVDVSEIRNKEKIIAKILKEEHGRLLEEVTVNNGKIILIFSNDRNYCMKMVVKQFSKEKYVNPYKNIEKFLQTKCYTHLPNWSVWNIIRTIDLSDCLLVFFKRNWDGDI